MAALRTLLDLFALLPMHGERPAVICRTGVRRLVSSYRQLHELSVRMAGVLVAAGINKGDRVLLWAPNGLWWVVIFWGCVQRGAVVVPVDFMSGPERAAAIAQLADVKLVVQSRLKAEVLSAVPALFVEALPTLLDQAPLPPSVSINPDDTAELVYTSGTTGSPKGVVLSHANLLANLLQVNRHIPVVGPQFVFLSLLPLSHMFEQMAGFLTPLYHGAAIVYPWVLKPSALRDAFCEEDIHAVVCVPRLLQLFKTGIEQELAGKGLSAIARVLFCYGRRLPRRLRTVLFQPIRRRFGRNFVMFVAGGAPLAAELFRFWDTVALTVVEGYGLTECSPVLAANTLEFQRERSVGRALPGVELRIESGEIQVRGANVFAGYYQNERANRDAFTDDGWFRTGDLGRFDQDGNLCILGRQKELIVTGAGVNVYPDDVEQVLDAQPGVRESCVIGIDRGAGEEVHAVLLLDGSGRRLEEIVAAANERLDPLQRIAGSMLWPEAEFPKTTTLKIRKFLVKERLRGGPETVAPVSLDPLVALIVRVTECSVAEVTEDALLVGGLGLSSIGQLELVSCLEQEYRLDLEDSLVDESTTVGDLRRIVAARHGTIVARRLRFWSNSVVLRMVRRLGDLVFHFPLLRVFVALRISGVDHLAGVQAPVMFVANHLSYLDQPVLMRALPSSWRYRTATAAWEEFFFKNYRSWPGWLWKRFTYEYGTLLLNLFPLPQIGGFRPALAFMGKLADHQHNILLFPEGERSRDGRLLPFRPGVGVMVAELGIPVIPVCISGLEGVLPRGSVWPHRGVASVKFGAPLRFAGQTPAEIVAQVRQAVADLQ
jgi:long-chain acyl-CoA synthetase